MNMRLHRQKGASLVEMAIVLLLFLMIIFAIFEFGLVMFRSAQLAEATHGGLRYAIVNDPLTELPSCIDADTFTQCETGSCSGETDDMIARMAAIAPLINQAGTTVTVKYSCPASGSLDHDGLYLTTVMVSGAKYIFMIPGILGLDTAMNLQEFKSTRLSEDLHTVVTGG